MFRQELLGIVRPEGRLADTGTLRFLEGLEENGYISSGDLLDTTTGRTYPVKNGYLDLLGRRTGASNPANLTNFLPGAGPLYEPLWRVHSMRLLTGEYFPIDRELKIIADLVQLDRGGRYLDLGCSAGMYTRNLAAKLGDRGDLVGIDISPSMLKESARRARHGSVSLMRAEVEALPFTEASFAGVVCGGSLNEFGDPARALRETRRVLEPGGRVAIMGILKAKTSYGRRLQRFLSVSGVRFFEPEEVQACLGHAGLEPDPLLSCGAAFFAGATRH